MAMTEYDKIAKYGPIVAKVNSSSEPDKVYDVRCKGGVYGCQCKGYIFSKDRPKTCRHIRGLKGEVPTVQKASPKKPLTTSRPNEKKSRWALIIEQLFKDVPIIGRLIEKHLSKSEQALALQALAQSLEKQLGDKALTIQSQVAEVVAEIEEEEGIRFITLME